MTARIGYFEIRGFDEIDNNILNILQKDGRASYAKIAKKVGLTVPSVIRRVKNLEQFGFVRNYQANLNPEPLGIDIEAFVYVKKTPEAGHEDAAGGLNTFENWMKDSIWIREFHVFPGHTFPVEYLLRIVSRNHFSYSEFLKKELSPRVEIVRADISTGGHKKYGLPICGICGVGS